MPGVTEDISTYTNSSMEVNRQVKKHDNMLTRGQHVRISMLQVTE